MPPALRARLAQHATTALHSTRPMHAARLLSPRATLVGSLLRPRLGVAVSMAGAACGALCLSSSFSSRTSLASESSASRESREAEAEAESVTSRRDLRTEETKSEAGGGLQPRKAVYDPAVRFPPRCSEPADRRTCQRHVAQCCTRLVCASHSNALVSRCCLLCQAGLIDEGIYLNKILKPCVRRAPQPSSGATRMQLASLATDCSRSCLVFFASSSPCLQDE